MTFLLVYLCLLFNIYALFIYVNYLIFLPMVMHMHIKLMNAFGNWLIAFFCWIEHRLQKFEHDLLMWLGWYCRMWETSGWRWLWSSGIKSLQQSVLNFDLFFDIAVNGTSIVSSECTDAEQELLVHIHTLTICKLHNVVWITGWVFWCWRY